MNQNDVKNLKVAIVHDFMTVDGGADQVLRALHEIWPSAPVFTITYFPEKYIPNPYGNWDIRTSFVSKLPFNRKFEDQYKLFYQFAVERFNLSDYDLVISSTWAGYAKGVVVGPNAKHFSYIDTVPRFLWGLTTAKHNSLNIFWKMVLYPLESIWRIWDKKTADRPDKLIADSKTVADRIKKFYRRDATVIYPPVDVTQMEEIIPDSKANEEYFLYFGRLEEYKRVDIAIHACVKASKKLKIIGNGNYRKQLENLVAELGAEGNVEFLGRLPDKERNQVIANCRAILSPCPDEDFGIVPVEAMAAGKPVIAFNSGGVSETVIDGKTGILVKDFSVDAYADAIKKFETKKYSSAACKNRAKSFDKEVFKNNIIKFVVENYE